MIWWQAFTMGLAIAAPLGPIGVLCLMRTLQQGPLTGFVAGLGAASADAVFAALGMAGNGAVMAWAQAWTAPLQALASVLLMVMAWQIWRSSPSGPAQRGLARSRWRSYLQTLLLTLSNPMTILSFLALAAAMPGSSASLGRTLAFVSGIFCGSAAWWAFLAFGGGALLQGMGERLRGGLNAGSAMLLLGFALILIWRLQAALQ